MSTLTPIQAKQVLEILNGISIERQKVTPCAAYMDEKKRALQRFNIRTFGNKGRVWSDTCCITNLDELKGECNPRLSSNYSTLLNIGCPECIKALKTLSSEA